MKKKYYVTKVEEIEVDEPIFETLSATHAVHGIASASKYEEAMHRLEAITGEKVIDGNDPFDVGICGLYNENNEAIFEL